MINSEDKPVNDQDAEDKPTFYEKHHLTSIILTLLSTFFTWSTMRIEGLGAASAFIGSQIVVGGLGLVFASFSLKY